MEGRTNCKNCGAPLKYSKNDYGKTARCEYCRTEYHIDLLGRIEEYKVKIEVFGKVREYYVGEICCDPICFDGGRDFQGRLSIARPIYKTKLELIEL